MKKILLVIVTVVLVMAATVRADERVVVLERANGIIIELVVGPEGLFLRTSLQPFIERNRGMRHLGIRVAKMALRSQVLQMAKQPEISGVPGTAHQESYSGMVRGANPKVLGDYVVLDLSAVTVDGQPICCLKNYFERR